MKRLCCVLLAAALCLTSCASAEGWLSRIGELFSNLTSENDAFVVGEDVVLEDIDDFYFTYDSSTNPPRFQRYRFYTENGQYYFYHEKREGDHWPLTPEDVTVSGTILLTEAQWAAFYAYLCGGTVGPRTESLEDGDAGPWTYLYWTGDQSRYQEFSFSSWGMELDFEAFCVSLMEQEPSSPPENAPRGKTVHLSFDSFDGGGPEYTVRIADPSVVACASSRDYRDRNYQELDGAGYTVTFAFTSLNPGETQVTIDSWSPIIGSETYIYAAIVDEDLNLDLRLLTTEYPDAMLETYATLVIMVNGRVFCASVEDNPAAEALMDLLSSGALEMEMRDDGAGRKAAALPWSLPADDAPCTAGPGDVILFQRDHIGLCCGQVTGDFVLLASIGNVTEEDMADICGQGDVTVCFWLEWSE